jgi:predicted  nucleic acid-binding Zn-ribbon protein
MSQISNLYRLQQIDSQLDSAIIKLQSIEKILLDNSTVITTQQKVAQAEEYLKSVSKKMRDAENRSHDTRIKTELAEKSLYGGKIQNPKELQELQNEIASLKRLLVSLEDKQLEAMMEVENSESKLMWANEELHEIQKTQIEHNAVLIGEKTSILSQVERLKAEREATHPTILAPDLDLYEQLRKSRNGVAVVKITSRACTACGTTLTAALVQATQSPGQLTRCPTCGRILYPG